MKIIIIYLLNIKLIISNLNTKQTEIRIVTYLLADINKV
jgi:hypothetical protein